MSLRSATNVEFNYRYITKKYTRLDHRDDETAFPLEEEDVVLIVIFRSLTMSSGSAYRVDRNLEMLDFHRVTRPFVGCLSAS